MKKILIVLSSLFIVSQLQAANVAGKDIIGSSMTLTGTIAITNGGELTGTKTGVKSTGNTTYTVTVSSTLGVAGVAQLTLADGKAGCFEVIAGTFCALGSFTSAAAVTLASNSSVDTSTTESNEDRLNVSDGGTIVYITNRTGASKVVYIRYTYTN